MKLQLPPEEIGRFLTAYYRGIFKGFPHSNRLGGAFLLFYGVIHKDLAKELDDDKALEIIKREFVTGY